MIYRELYLKGRAILEEAHIAEADLDARLLLEQVCHTNRNDLLVHGEQAVEAAKETQYLEWIRRRAKHIPLQHLTGVQEFMGLSFAVNEHVLIPRQDTEILVEEVLRHLHDGMSILDMCTGSGCILISLLHYSNNCMGVGVDISKEALAVAEENAEKLLQQKLKLLEGDLFGPIEDGVFFDRIVSNPPYIPSRIVDALMPEVRDHEPRQALDGREDGLFFYRQIITGSRKHLKGGGMLFFEIGYDQGEAVSGLMEQEGFQEVQIKKDYAGLDRVVYGTMGFDWFL